MRKQSRGKQHREACRSKCIPEKSGRGYSLIRSPIGRLRRHVLERDGWRCQDCGTASALLVQYLTPRRTLGLGDKEQAFAWLERAYQEQSNILQFLKVHPYFDPLREDPRFKDLLHRVWLG